MKSLYHKAALVLFPAALFGLIIYSYALVDPNFTPVNHPYWTVFRNLMVQFGYYNSAVAGPVYLALVGIVTYCHIVFVRNAKSVSPSFILVSIGILAVLSYPFLSHDLFNYMFDARILTYYGKNPYLFKALDFPSDDWIRFMHWTHRTYPYGPTFLPFTLVPSFLSFGKLVLNFVLFKAFFFMAFAVSGIALYRMNKKWGVYFMTSPFIIIEGLVNAHNDIIAVSAAIVGIYFLWRGKAVWAGLLFLFSGGIKYITAPFLALLKDGKKTVRLVLVVTMGILGYFTFFSEIQPWYFLVLLGILPYYETLIDRSTILFTGLLLSYCPYIRSAGWGDEQIFYKHIIIGISFALFLISFRLRKKIIF